MKIELLYKILGFAIAVVFSIFISDIRKKYGMKSILKKPFIIAMKVCYLVTIGIYFYTLYKIERLKVVTDWGALLLITMGTFLIIKAKIDLGDNNTWVGYYKNSSVMVTKGIYSFMRHPICTGIYLFFFGVLFTVLMHQFHLALIVIPILSYIMAIIAIAGKKETEYLRKKFGAAFEIYRKTVHPFLPLRKFSLQNRKFKPRNRNSFKNRSFS